TTFVRPFTMVTLSVSSLVCSGVRTVRSPSSRALPASGAAMQRARRSSRSGLAARAPVGRAGLGAVAGHADGRPAATTALAVAAVDVEPSPRAVDPGASGRRQVLAEEPGRHLHQPSALGLLDPLDR